MMKKKFKGFLALILTLCICFCSIPFTLGANAATVTPRAAASSYYTIILRPDGSVWASGYNEFGQLGIGNNTNQTKFTRCIDSNGNYINDAVDVATGEVHTLILRSNGTVWAAGCSDNGRLGNGITTDQNRFVQVATDVRLPSGSYNTIACGSLHSAIIKTDGYVYTSGLNDEGQLGLNDTNNRSSFTQVTVNISNNVVSVACGSEHTAVITSDGTLYTTGLNTNGQLCRNTYYTKYNSAFINTGYSSATAISCGPDFTLAIINGNLYKSFGSRSGVNYKGSFSQVETGVSSVFCQDESYSIIKTDGSLYASGANDSGQLGLGNTTNPSGFQKVNLSNVASVSEGIYTYHSVAITKDGLVYATGNNEFGQLGNGTTTNQSSYTQVTLDINGNVDVSNNSFKSFLSSITFGYFFKDSATVTISATEGGTSTAVSNSNIKYYLSDTAKTQSSLTSLTGWQSYTGKFSINAAKKQIVYVKITSSFGNTKYISSDGLVIYNPLEVTYSKVPDFVQTQSIDIEIPFNLNGNTIASITKGGTDIGSSNYTLGDSSVTIKNAYLKTLTADNLTTFAINYNPVGAAWTDTSKGDKPSATEFQINIIGKKPASATISVGGNDFTSLAEQPEFMYFFKENTTVTIGAQEQNGDAISNSKIVYYLSDEAKTLEQLKALTDWTGYTGTINIPATSKKIVYAKITDSFEGDNYFSSNGFVVYAEPKVTKADESQSFAKSNDKDANVNVELNGSEVADILLNGVSIESSNYSINGSTITISQDYLKTLDSNEDYTFTIVYSTLGQTWSDGSQGSQPTSTFKLRVVDSLLASTSADSKDNLANHNVVGVANFESAVNVTIDWGSLTYSYNATWDDETQSWKDATWQNAENADKITIENRSSQACDLLLDFTPKDEYKSDDPNNSIVGTFVTTSGDASTAVPDSKLSLDRLKAGTVYLKLDGINDQKFNNGELTDQVFGVVTITLQGQ